PEAAIEPKTVDRRRRFYAADAVETDAGPLKAALLQHPPRGRIADAGASLQRRMAEIAKGVIDHRAHRFRGIAAAPMGGAKPIADLGNALARLDAAGADHLVVKRNDER